MIDHKEAGLPARALRRLSRMLGRWAPSRNGAVAPLFAVLAGVLLLGAGVGMDLSRVTSSRNQLQDAIDAAGLALARMPADSDMDTVLKPAAQNWVRANLHGTTLDPDAVTVTLTRIATGVQISAVTNVQPTLAGVVHVGPFAVTATSTVKYQVNQVEVALVLDNTFSMSVPLDGAQSKIDVLKKAASDLTDTLMTPANAGGVKMGVVPYAEYVNVGVNNRYATWITGVVDDFSTVSVKQAGTPAQDAVPPKWVDPSCRTVTPSSTQCVGGVKGTCYNYKDGVPVSSYSCWTTPQTCTTTYGTPYQQCTAGYWTTGTPAKPATPDVMGTKYTKWFGCVLNQVTSSKLATPDPGTPYKGIMEQFTQWDDPNFNSGYCLTPILPLNTDKTAVKAAIAGMITSQTKPSTYTTSNPVYYPETYVPGGLHWGVNVLSPAAPFAEGAAYDPNNKMPRKALILMTDGENTRALQSNGTVAAGTAAQMTQTYSDQQRMCQYAKDKKIEVYTIGFGVTDSTALANLKSCATDASHYFDAQSSDGLLNAFKVIAGSLSNLRIAH